MGSSDCALLRLTVAPVPDCESPKLQSADRQEVGLGVGRDSRGQRSACNPSRAGGNPAVSLTTRAPPYKCATLTSKWKLPLQGMGKYVNPGVWPGASSGFPSLGHSVSSAAGQGPLRPAQQQRPKEAWEVPWAGRAEACLLHLQPGSVFLWPCGWKLQLLAVAQAHLDKSPFPRRDGLEEGPLSVWKNIPSSASSLYVLHVSIGLVYTQKASFFQN